MNGGFFGRRNGAIPTAFLVLAAALAAGAACRAPGPARTSDGTATLETVSPYCSGAGSARFRVTVFSPSGRGLNTAMMDAGCFQVTTEDGAVLRQDSEGLASLDLDLGGEASLSRVVDLKDLLRGLPPQTVKVGWRWNGLTAPPREERVYPWDLADVEAVVHTSLGDMILEFFPRKAPLTVKNFVDLSLRGFYDNLTFHRVVPGFMIQGGDPAGDGTGDPGYYIKGEFTDISHVRGVLSMARSQDPDSGGCQFFIMLADHPELDGLYAAFGRLTSGFDTLDRIAAVPCTAQPYGDEISRPVDPPRILSIRIRPKKGSGSDRE